MSYLNKIILWLVMGWAAYVVLMLIVGLLLNIVVSFYLDIICFCSSIKNFLLKICGVHAEEEVYDLTIKADIQINEFEEQDFFHKYILK